MVLKKDKEQLTHRFHMLHKKIVATPGHTVRKSTLAVISQLLLDGSQPLNTLTDSAGYLNLDDGLLDRLRRIRILWS